MDQGLIIFLTCIGVLAIAVFIFQMIHKGFFRKFRMKKKDEEKKTAKAAPTKEIKDEKQKKQHGNISYFKFILSISASIILSIVVIYIIVWLVRLYFDFNLIRYIL